MRTAVLFVIMLALSLAALPPASGQQRTSYIAYLSGEEEVPRNTSTATGLAVFEMTPQGLRYWVYVNNLNNVQMGHIHIAPAGQNGAVTVWLYPPAPPARPIAGVFSGLLQEGTITNANLTGPLQGRTLADLIAAMNAGNAYVNLHTNQFPGGEIRGQIR